MLLVEYHYATVLSQNSVYLTRNLMKVAFFGDLFGIQRSEDVMQETMNLWFPSGFHPNVKRASCILLVYQKVAVKATQVTQCTCRCCRLYKTELL